MNTDLYFRSVKPDNSLSDFVESFWSLENKSNQNIETIGLPDGRVDLMFSISGAEKFKITLIGLGTEYHLHGDIPANSLLFSISFTPLAVDYILKHSIADYVNFAKELPDDFWGFNADDLHDFELFCKKASQKIQDILPYQIDERKRKLFNLIYASKGELAVRDLAEKVGWSSRQINRYFNQQFGLSLKTYCNILRFRASLDHIAKGKLFPELNFTDQNHFIKDIKKFSGVVPKELSKNQNDRFILLSVLKE